MFELIGKTVFVVGPGLLVFYLTVLWHLMSVGGLESVPAAIGRGVCVGMTWVAFALWVVT